MMSQITEIEYKNCNLGVVRYGNFKRYYQFYSAENRIKLLPTNIWKTNENTYNGLDIGCNTGDLTVLLVDFFKKIYGDEAECNFLGIDVDPNLILQAKEKHKSKMSVQFECTDFMNNKQTGVINEYLENYNKSRFNVTFCLRVSMWIHLNHGDEGLKTFLKKICNYSNIVVIEPQSWISYIKQMERIKQVDLEFPLFKQLVYGENVEEYIDNIIKDCDFIKVHESYTSDGDRKILFYKRNNIT